MVSTEQIGVNGLTNENRIFYEQQLLTRAVPLMLHTGWGLQKDIPNNMGNSINFRRFERPSAATTALTEGTAGNTTAMTVTSVNLTVVQYGAWDRFSDLAVSQGIDDVIQGLSGAFAEQMAVTIDVLARDTIAAGTNVAYANGSSRGGLVGGSSSSQMSATFLKSAARELQAANARPLSKAGGNYVAFVHPDTWSDLFSDSLMQNALQYAGLRGDTNPLFSGSIFDYSGIRLQRTSNAKIFGSAGLSCGSGIAGIYATVVIGEEAYGEVRFAADNVRLKVKPIGSAGAQDPLDQYGTVGWKASYGVKRLNESFIYRLEHTVSNNSGLGRQAGNATP